MSIKHIKKTDNKGNNLWKLTQIFFNLLLLYISGSGLPWSE